VPQGYPRDVGLHHITWRATASAVSNVDAVADAITWLIGDESWVDVERTTSHYGSEIHMVAAFCKKKSAALDSFARLGSENLALLSKEFETRMDESNTLHFRIDLNALIAGKVILSDASKPDTIKGQIKIEVYPGQTIQTEFDSILAKASEQPPSILGDENLVKGK
jgi:RNA binding exosome subunit